MLMTMFTVDTFTERAQGTEVSTKTTVFTSFQRDTAWRDIVFHKYRRQRLSRFISKVPLLSFTSPLPIRYRLGDLLNLYIVRVFTRMPEEEPSCSLRFHL